MNKFFNWTFGSVFRTIGRVIGYLIVGALLGLILQKNGVRIRDLIPTLKVSAKEFSTTETYRVYRCDYQNDYSCSAGFTNWTNNGTSTTIAGTSYVVRGYSMNFSTSSTLSAGGVYRVSIDFYSNPKPTTPQILETYSCFGGTSTGNTGGESENIQSCELTTTIPTSDGVRYIFNVVPSVNIHAIKINIYLHTGYGKNGNMTVRGLSSSLLSNDTSTSDAINSQTDQLLDNQNQNAQDIINNQNELLGSQCENIVDLSGFNTQTLNGVTFTNNNDGTITINGTATNSFGITFFRPTLTSGNYTFNSATINAYIYDYSSYTSILTNGQTNKSINGTYNNIGLDTWINNGQNFNNVLFKPMITKSSNVKSFCKYGTYSSKLDDTNNSINDLKDSINDDNVSSSQTDASNFFGNFTTNTHGLTGIITAPLNAINSLTSATCSPLVLPLPFVNQNLTLPCMRQIYTDNFGGFMQLYDVIVIGIIAYWICVRIFSLVKDFKNPEHDEIEVVDL